MSREELLAMANKRALEVEERRLGKSSRGLTMEAEAELDSILADLKAERRAKKKERKAKAEFERAKVAPVTTDYLPLSIRGFSFGIDPKSLNVYLVKDGRLDRTAYEGKWRVEDGPIESGRFDPYAEEEDE